MNDKSVNVGLLFLRIFAGGMILFHGIPKLGLLLAGNGSTFLNPLGIGPTMSLVLCVIAEVFCATLLIFGAFTRLCAMVLCFNMIAAMMFLYQSGSPFLSGIELPLLYFGMYFTLLITGAGNISIDKRVCAEC